MDERVREQIEHMIDTFGGTVPELRRLVADLDALWNAETWSEDTRREFRREWGKLDEVYATAVERWPRILTEVDVARVRRALNNLRPLLPP